MLSFFFFSEGRSRDATSHHRFAESQCRGGFLGGRGGIRSGSWKCNDGNDPIGDTPAFH